MIKCSGHVEAVMASLQLKLISIELASTAAVGADMRFVLLHGFVAVC